ncbi:MAG TPA: SRPBCC domain-containing protein [Minicystis sp.]|nr:SRPBCC domain-containing protein [Minicystis sp.]
MSKETITVTAVLPASPGEVYDAWLDSATHSKMTGGAASIDPRVGGRHAAWDGYIQGTNLELMPGLRIVQSWRSSDFPADADDSRIVVLLAPDAGGTRVTIHHSEIPAGQGQNYEAGWQDHYFRPMAEYFASVSEREPETLPAPFPIEADQAEEAPVDEVLAYAPAEPSAPEVTLVAFAPDTDADGASHAERGAKRPAARKPAKKRGGAKKTPRKTAKKAAKKPAKRGAKKAAKPARAAKRPAKKGAKKAAKPAAKKSAKKAGKRGGTKARARSSRR